MNYLFHLQLSDPAPLCRLGNLMGDFVKGRLDPDDWHPQLFAGLTQHRALDRFAHHQPVVRASKERLHPRFGLLRSVIIDIFYDHFLARNWSGWVGGDLEEFSAGIYHSLQHYDKLLVPGFRPVARRMAENDWLSSYREAEIIALVLRRMSQRLRRPNLLEESFDELGRCDRELEQDCFDFLQVARQNGFGEQSDNSQGPG